MIRKSGIEFLSLWMAIVLLLPCYALADSVYSDFTYILNTDGQAVITRYTGRDKNVELPWNIEGKMVAEIGPEAFAGNTTIETVKLPIGVTVIRENAFKGCVNLKNVELPSRLETIEEGAFLGCTALKELEIPESVVEINMECFEDWTLLMGNKNSIAVDYAKALGLNYRETYQSEILGDNEKAIESLEKSTELDNPYAYIELGMVYEYGYDDIFPDASKAEMYYQRAIELLQTLADNGDPEACHNIAFLNDSGRGVQVNHEKALQYYQKAAESGYSASYIHIGHLYKYGRGVEKNIEKAIENYCKAAEMGDSLAYRILGELYEEGIEVQRDDTKALAYYQKAVELGDETARNKLEAF